MRARTSTGEGAAIQQSGPLARHVAAMGEVLHGPARVKSRMMAEIREGLTDAAAAHAEAGMSAEQAAREAVREFGTVKELTPGFQRELTVAQTRHTARALALTAPLLLIACWLLIWRADHGETGQQLGFADQLAAPLGVAAVVAVAGAGAAVGTLLGLAALAVTGSLSRRLPTPRRLPGAIAWAGTAVGVAAALATLTLGVTSALVADWLLLACAGALTAASHGVVATSARVCRRCARLPVT